MQKNIPEEFIQKFETAFPDNKTISGMLRCGIITPARRELQTLCRQPMMTAKEMLEAIYNGDLDSVRSALKTVIEHEKLLSEFEELTK